MKKEDRNAQQVLEDELVSIGIFTNELAANPTEALYAVLNWHTDVALDPAVSSDARVLEFSGYNRGWKEGRESLIRELNQYFNQS